MASPKTASASSASPVTNMDAIANAIVFRSSQGGTVRAVVIKLTRQSVTFELCTPDEVLRLSEALENFEIFAGEHCVYKGKAVVSSLVTTGAVTVCQARLSEDLLKLDMSALGEPDAVISPAFKSFFKKWQSFYKISPEYKLVVADIQSFLHDLRLWLDQLEMRVAGSPEEQTKLERAVLHELATSPVLYGLFERFENIAESIPEEHRAAHRAFGQRQLHSLLLCSPFLYRTYSKPLGFAGDYEMMNMIVRNQSEGQSLYAKVINSYLLSQVAPQAVRNRVGFLQDRILSETSRVARAGGVANIFCIACGPAWEARNFVAESPLADRARFRLLDFNEETLEHARVKMEEASRHNHRKTTVEVVKNSVQNLLKAGRRTNSPSGGYDLIYCSGLYDYLNEHVIKALNSYLYNLLQPGGLLVVGNFAVGTPVRNFMEHFAEWFLIYRSSQELAALGPTQVPLQECRVVSELTGANLFLEVRKSQ